MYFLMLKPKDGYSFSEDTAMTVNGENVQSGLSGNFLYAPVVKTIAMPTVIGIDVVEINDVTVRFKDGDKPVFTGKRRKAFITGSAANGGNWTTRQVLFPQIRSGAVIFMEIKSPLLKPERLTIMVCTCQLMVMLEMIAIYSHLIQS